MDAFCEVREAKGWYRGLATMQKRDRTQISVILLCQHSNHMLPVPSCHSPQSEPPVSAQHSPQPVLWCSLRFFAPQSQPSTLHCTPESGSVPHLLSALSTSCHSRMVEGCLETQVGNGFSGALCGAFLSWVASAAPPHVQELPGPGLCLLSFRKPPAPGQPFLLTPHSSSSRPPESKTLSQHCV